MSKVVYRLLLRLYPSELRSRWGQDMLDLFERQLEDDWLNAWFCAVLDLRLAWPLQAARQVLLIPLFSAAVSATMLSCLIWALENSKALLWLSHHLFANQSG